MVPASAVNTINTRFSFIAGMRFQTKKMQNSEDFLENPGLCLKLWLTPDSNFEVMPFCCVVIVKVVLQNAANLLADSKSQPDPVLLN